MDAITRASFEQLARQFGAASSSWPNLEAVIFSWPEGEPPPTDGDLPPRWKSTFAVEVPAPEGEQHFVALPYGIQLDGAPKRYRKGMAGMMVLTRDFSQWGDDPRKISNPQREVECIRRYKHLCNEASSLLERIADECNLGENTMLWPGTIRWRLAVFDILKPPPEIFAGKWSYQRFVDFSMASESAIVSILSSNGETLDGWKDVGFLGISINVAHMKARRNGKEVEFRGRKVPWDMFAKLCRERGGPCDDRSLQDAAGVINASSKQNIHQLNMVIGKLGLKAKSIRKVGYKIFG
jgi:hypothetical protein